MLSIRLRQCVCGSGIPSLCSCSQIIRSNIVILTDGFRQSPPRFLIPQMILHFPPAPAICILAPQHPQVILPESQCADDRLWPRGISKTRADLSEWNKDIAPTSELRKWFGHKPENVDAFKERYWAELDDNRAAFDFAEKCRTLLQEGNVTLVYGAKSPTCNHAVILRDWLNRHL